MNDARRCWKCLETKPLSQGFYKDRSDKSGYQKCCKECTKAANRAFRKRRPAYNAEYNWYGSLEDKRAFNKQRYQRKREEYLKRHDATLRTPRGRLYQLFWAAKDRAAKKNLPFEISMDWLVELYESQNGKCALTGISFDLGRNKSGENGFRPFSPSLDQKIPGRGYTNENTRLICTSMNLALNRFGEDVFYRILRGYCVTTLESTDKRLEDAIPTFDEKLTEALVGTKRGCDCVCCSKRYELYYDDIDDNQEAP